MAHQEARLIDTLRLKLSRAGARIFRQGVGLGWTGKILNRAPDGTVTLAKARPLRAGLCTGSSDTIGWRPYIITAEDVGRRVAVFTAIEVKTPGVKLTDEQRAFLAVVRDSGGIAIEARDVDETVRQVVEWRPS